MIVRIHASGGKSFSGTAAYLTHDANQAQTDERVAWTHTRNLANDYVPSAVDEMLWTARNAELLKQEAGVRAGGRATESPVKHLSLNWSPEDNPSPEHMIQTTEGFLRHMGWHENQAVLVAHNDKPYAHVHVMLNVVHPETGLRLDDNFERRRAQAWALDYERENGRIYCEQRLKEPEQREKAMPRNIWVAFQENEKEFARAETSLRQQESILIVEREIQKNNEWEILKNLQHAERMGFFADGKSEFNTLRTSIYREVRDEFRERWADYYDAAKKDGDPDVLASRKAELVADQKAVLEARRDEACRELREHRDGIYRELLDEQREVRLDLGARQEAGLDNTEFLRSLGGQEAIVDIRSAFREAAEATTRRGDEGRAGFEGERLHEDADSRASASGAPAGDMQVALGACAVFDSFLSIFEGPPSNPRPRSAEEIMTQAAEDTCKRERQEREEPEREEEKRQRSTCE